MKSSIFGDYEYDDLIDEIVVFEGSKLKEAFDQLEEYKKTFFCVGFVSYEAYKAFGDSNFYSSFPLLYFGIFARRKSLEIPDVKHQFFPFKQSFIDRESYIQKVQFLRDQIAQGNTYQGNLTHFFDFSTTLLSRDLFFTLLKRQNTAYKAFLPTPFGDILSFSPELFFSIRDQTILAKPMKGTARRGKDAKEDQKIKEFLRNDVKNRSENVMIVDLLRNDLSKIVKQDSLRVTKLFEIETYPTLFQMTSTIQGRLDSDFSMQEVFKALFPCGSITGAPKKITLEILQSLEGRERGVYCGAIGMMSKKESVFSIPIRTIFKKGERCSYGVGSGIVWDSDPLEEYEELHTKMSFLLKDFFLLETMLYTPQVIRQEFLEIPNKIAFISEHLRRLQKSAKSLGFVYPQDLPQKLDSLKFNECKIIRVLLAKSGEYQLEILPFDELKSFDISLIQKEGKSDFCMFKTTVQRAPIPQELFDVIYHQNGILLEGGRSNVVLEMEDGLFTPKYEENFLRGVCREVLLQRGVIQERRLSVQDLKNAKRIFCINSVRGMLEVNLV